MNKDYIFKEKLKTVFSSYYETIELIDYLIDKKRNSQEIILLVCSRLDSLSNLAIKNTQSQKRSFIKFLYNYSGEKRFFNNISVADLYQYLMYYGNMADGALIDVPGRIKRFGSDSDEFLFFIEKSSVPITGKLVRQITFRLAQLLKNNYRVKPKQRTTKKYIASSNEINNLIKKEIKIPNPSKIIKAIEPLLERFKIGSIFYKRYRCGVIHGYKVNLNEKEFFKNEKPYHGVFENLEERFFLIEFPAKYLKKLLVKSLETYIGELRSVKKFPLDLFNEMFDIEEIFDGDALDYLDDDTLDVFEEVPWKLRIN